MFEVQKKTIALITVMSRSPMASSDIVSIRYQKINKYIVIFQTATGASMINLSITIITVNIIYDNDIIDVHC